MRDPDDFYCDRDGNPLDGFVAVDLYAVPDVAEDEDPDPYYRDLASAEAA